MAVLEGVVNFFDLTPIHISQSLGSESLILIVGVNRCVVAPVLYVVGAVVALIALLALVGLRRRKRKSPG